jgi:peptidyl-prolyl cis-trans isomerase A (cyclophilin A)
MKQVLMTVMACGIALAQAPAEPSLLNVASLKAKAPETFDVKFTTTKGDVTVRATRAWAPNGVDRFYNLVRAGFFTDAAFFRVIPGFVVQFGLSADPAVNNVWRKSNFKDDTVTQSNKPGFITFATAGKDTRTTQLFINTGNNAQLDKMGFAPFGQVISGMDVVKKIHSGYGEAPDQGSITALGKAYLDKNFPKLDRINSATIA